MSLPAEAARALDHLARFGIHLGLDHVRRLLSALGDPQLAAPTVLVAGTNGKGSTATFLASMATAAGYRTGLYTSPHLETVEERIRIDGEPVDGALLGREVLAVLEAAEGIGHVGDDSPTYFEVLTAAAHRIFRDAAVDLAVLEVGLGGRLDATNAAEPVLSVITAVSVEHREVLGDTPAAVAREKAGVLRPGRPAVAWGVDPEVRRTLRSAAADLGTALVFADDDVRVHAVRPLPPVPWGGLAVELETPVRRYALETALPGRHQAANLSMAVRAAELLSDHGWQRLDTAAIVEGAAGASWPGRLESVLVPVAGGGGGLTGRRGPALRVVLDAAHNPAAAAALAGFLDEAMEAGGVPPVLVFGVLADKEVAEMLPPLASRASHLLLTRPPGDRGRDPRDLLALVPPGVPTDLVPVPEEALDHALRRAASHAPSPPVLVCGSIFLAGKARAHLRRRVS